MNFSPLALWFALARQGESGGATDPAASGGGLFDLLPPMLAILAIFYFVLIAPERKKQKQKTALMAALKKGDKVMTSSGIYATVAQLKEDEITLIVADGVRVRFNRAAIQDILTEKEKDSE